MSVPLAILGATAAAELWDHSGRRAITARLIEYDRGRGASTACASASKSQQPQRYGQATLLQLTYYIPNPKACTVRRAIKMGAPTASNSWPGKVASEKFEKSQAQW